jgi:hypothetical protein
MTKKQTPKSTTNGSGSTNNGSGPDWDRYYEEPTGKGDYLGTHPITEKELSLTDKLIKIQAELKSPKNQKNTYGGYNYRSCEDILEAVKPLLNKYDLAIKIRDNIEMIGDRYYVKATVIIGNGKNITKTSAYARETLDRKGMDESQITGATSSYARKYALNGMFAIDDARDADTMDNTKVEKKVEQKTNVKSELMKKIDKCNDLEKLNNIREWVEKNVKNNDDLLSMIDDKEATIIGDTE